MKRISASAATREQLGISGQREVEYVNLAIGPRAVRSGFRNLDRGMDEGSGLFAAMIAPLTKSSRERMRRPTQQPLSSLQGKVALAAIKDRRTLAQLAEPFRCLRESDHAMEDRVVATAAQVFATAAEK